MFKFKVESCFFFPDWSTGFDYCKIALLIRQPLSFGIYQQSWHAGASLHRIIQRCCYDLTWINPKHFLDTLPTLWKWMDEIQWSSTNDMFLVHNHPVASLNGLFSYIYHEHQTKCIGKSTIHGLYGKKDSPNLDSSFLVAGVADSKWLALSQKGPIKSDHPRSQDLNESVKRFFWVFSFEGGRNYGAHKVSGGGRSFVFIGIFLVSIEMIRDFFVVGNAVSH